MKPEEPTQEPTLIVNNDVVQVQDVQNASSAVMLDDKRPFYVWLFIILVNVITYLSLVVAEVYDSHRTVQEVLFEHRNSTDYVIYIMGIALIVTIIPVWISGLQKKWRHKVGYGIPILLLLPVPYFIYDWMTCTGKLCELTGMMFTFVLGIGAVSFAISYTLGVFLKKWNVNVSKVLLWIEAFIIAIGILYLCYSSYLDYRFNSFVNNANTPEGVSQVMTFCNKLDDLAKQYTCFQRVVELNPEANVCSLVQEQGAKNRCLLLQKNINKKNINL